MQGWETDLIRTLDALHLAVYIQLAQLYEVTLVSADRKVCNVAEELGYPVINPEWKPGPTELPVFPYV